MTSRKNDLLSTRKFFQRLPKLHEPVGRVQFVVLQVLIYSKLHEKNYVITYINIREKIRGGYR